MHLKSLSLKGFKSFPERTHLAFGPGVSVVVGPNGSGKSNVTDAVLWAMGEQSPVAVRGSSMQDVIFGGGRGRQAGQAAEVELVLDNSCGTLPLGGAEVSILRRLDRSGEGEYRLNGARCRLVDVLEVLSDTGLGKESHSVVSQGRVEQIVTSKPRDRRLLIEEAAGLGKHRKRRRRAQLKLARTEDNLDRALDVEREARARLKPLKRQAEAAELHERLERQSLEARWTLAREALRAGREALALAETKVAAAREARARDESALSAVASRREAAEEALARRSEQREELSGRVFAARGAAERVGDRREMAARAARSLEERVARGHRELAALEDEHAEDAPDAESASRLAELERSLEEVERDRRAEEERALLDLEARRSEAAAEVERLGTVEDERRAALAKADEGTDAARTAHREAERRVEEARREAARVGAELAAANQFLRSHAAAPGAARALADELGVEGGYELALAAALDGRLSAAIVADRPAGLQLLAGAGEDGGRAIVATSQVPGAGAAQSPPVPGARRLSELVRGPADVLALVGPLLASTWVVDDIDSVPGSFAGTAVTREGMAWSAHSGELRRLAAGGADRVLAERNRRDALVSATEAAAQAEGAVRADAQGASDAVSAADREREAADGALRAVRRERDAAREDMRRAEELMVQRRAAPDEGPTAVRRAELRAQLEAERRLAEQATRRRTERERRLTGLTARVAREEKLHPAAARLAAALTIAGEAIAEQLARFEGSLAEDRAAGEHVAAELRACAREEAEVQGRLRLAADAVTVAEVAAQRARDAASDADAELTALASRLELAAEAATEPLDPAEGEALAQRVERLARRREQLGPVNPLAQEEYAESLAHVEELETQRGDLETAMRELADLIRDTDREIQRTFEETFEAAAANFEELAARLFPGGRGRLRLVREDAGPRPVLGGAEAASGQPAEESEDSAEDGADDGPELGVEIEITPAGKSMKRLTLLSGGEKSMTALAFLFAVFLARPCPFYILDEVEAALDDLNIDRFLTMLRGFADRAQFIVVTHQKRTMEAADCLYGVSMAGDGVSRVMSRRLPREDAPERAA
jgi:chromosome segregation protein